jgi:hypothetical protein
MLGLSRVEAKHPSRVRIFQPGTLGRAVCSSAWGAALLLPPPPPPWYLRYQVAPPWPLSLCARSCMSPVEPNQGTKPHHTNALPDQPKPFPTHQPCSGAILGPPQGIRPRPLHPVSFPPFGTIQHRHGAGACLSDHERSKTNFHHARLQSAVLPNPSLPAPVCVPFEKLDTRLAANRLITLPRQTLCWPGLCW